ITTEGNPVLLRFKADRIQHARQRGVFEINGFAGGAQAEAKLVLAEINKTPPGYRGVGGDDELVGDGIVAENAAAEVERLAAGVEKLDGVQIRQVGVRQKFIDDHRAQRFGAI